MSNYITLEKQQEAYESGDGRIPMYQYTYRLTGLEPHRITSNWYSTRAHATECLRRIYGDHIVPDSVQPVQQTAAHVPSWRIWGDKSKRYVAHVGGQMDVGGIGEVEL